MIAETFGVVKVLMIITMLAYTPYIQKKLYEIITKKMFKDSDFESKSDNNDSHQNIKKELNVEKQ